MKEIHRLKAYAEELEREKAALLRLQKRVPAPIVPKEKPGNSEAVAIAMLSDVHYEEEVKPTGVFHRNKYSVEIASTRLNQYFHRVARMIKKEQQDVAISTCILHLGGDFITGRIHEENLETCRMRPVAAICAVTACVRDGLRYLLDHTDVDFKVICSVGNHSRITKRVHASTEQGNSLEWFMYTQLCREFDSQRMRFILEEAYHTYYTVFGRVLRFHHGHQVKYFGGVGGITISLNKAIAQWNTVYRADYDFLGHHHQHMVTNNAVMNGSMIGYNAYSIAIKAPFEKPKQAFVLLDKDRGLTVSLPIMFTV